MSRMLKALQQIEARSPQQRPEPVPGEEPDSQRPSPQAEILQSEGETTPSGTVVDGAAVETVLARVEAAAAVATDVPAHEHDGAYAELADNILACWPESRCSNWPLGS